MLTLLSDDKTLVMLRIEQIETNGGTQMRAGLNEETITSYTEDMEGYGGWGNFPAVDVFYDGDTYWLANGFHRLKSFFVYCRDIAGILDMHERPSVPAIVYSGTRRDAVLFAAGANNDHGLRRSNEDKRRTIKMFLLDAEWGNWSDNEIARRCVVSPSTVGTVRKSLSKLDSDNTERTYTTKHGTTATMKTAKIGTGKPQSKRIPTAPQQRTVDTPVAPTVRYVSADPDDDGDPVVDVVTVARARRELASEIDMHMLVAESALASFEALARLVDDTQFSRQARDLLSKAKALKARGL